MPVYEKLTIALQPVAADFPAAVRGVHGGGREVRADATDDGRGLEAANLLCG